jgi:uncharacterized membrane protein
MDAIQKRAYCVALILVALLWKPVFAAQFIPLSDLVPAMELSEVRDVSNDGSTVIGAYSPDGVTGRAFHWRLGVGLVELLRPNLEPINGLTIAVSPDGGKVLGVDVDFGPFLWTEGAGTQFLNIFATDVYQVLDMSADGSVIVGEVRRESPQGSYYEAFRWNPTNGVTIINALSESNGGHTSSPKVSDDGTTVVGIHSFYHPDQTIDTDYAFVWTEEEGTINLGSPIGSTRSLGIEASANGSVILGQALGPSSDHFLWREASGFDLLGPYPDAVGEGTAYSAQDITPDGDLIAGFAIVSEGSPNMREPFVWDETRGFRSLRTILDTATGTPLTGWGDLGVGNAISADGTVIVGYGTPDGGQREQGWVMLFERGEIIPEPTSLLLITVALVIVAFPRAARADGSR